MNPNENPRFGTRSISPRPPTREQIGALAHAIWLDRGSPVDRDIDLWLEAEQQLRGDGRGPESSDGIPARAESVDPDRAVAGRVERELERIVIPPENRSPTAV